MDPTQATRGDEPHDEKRIGTQTVSYRPGTDQIDADDLWQALSNSRRRHVIRALEDGSRDIGPLARAIAAIENDIAVEDVDAQQRKRVWIGLRQAHLTKLDRWGIVEWKGLDDTVAPGPAHAEALAAIKAVAQADDDLQEALDEAGVEADDEPPKGSLEAEILETLREEGECSGPELKSLTDSRSEVYTALTRLGSHDLIAKRDDPDDGRRTLYRPAEMDVEEVEESDDDPEAYSGPEPSEVLDRHVDAAITVGNVLSACEGAGTVSEVAAELGVASKDLEPVLWELGLKQQKSRLLVEDLDDRLDAIRQEVEA